MLTPSDLRKPRNVSGYKQVGLVRGPSRSRTSSYYQAYAGPGRAGDWKGPARATALEAAQDYCNYANGKPIFSITITNNLKTAGHNGKRPSIPRDAEYEDALGYIRDYKAQREGKQGYVYLIAEVSAITGAVDKLFGYGKIGFSTNPEARVPELQTGNPRQLRLLGYKKGTVEDEAALHQKYLGNNVLQEWFRLTPELVAEFPSDGKAKVA